MIWGVVHLIFPKNSRISSSPWGFWELSQWKSMRSKSKPTLSWKDRCCGSCNGNIKWMWKKGWISNFDPNQNLEMIKSQRIHTLDLHSSLWEEWRRKLSSKALGPDPSVSTMMNHDPNAVASLWGLHIWTTWKDWRWSFQASNLSLNSFSRATESQCETQQAEQHPGC